MSKRTRRPLTPEQRLKWLCEFVAYDLSADLDAARTGLAAFLAMEPGGAGVAEIDLDGIPLRVNAVAGPWPSRMSQAALRDVQRDVQERLDAAAHEKPSWGYTSDVPEGADAYRSDKPTLAGWFPAGPPFPSRYMFRRGPGKGARAALEILPQTTTLAVAFIADTLLMKFGHRVRRCEDPVCKRLFLRGRKGTYHATACYQREYQEFFRDWEGSGMTFEQWKTKGRPRKGATKNG